MPPIGAGAAVTAIAALMIAGSASACELVLRSHRDEQTVLRIALPPDAPRFDIAFVHSVLGTPVIDRYEVRGAKPGDPARMHLVAEQFEGDGYGLPHTAATGETLARDGAVRTLHLDRPVHPLVVRPLRTQRTTLHANGQTWLLADLNMAAIEFIADGCR